MDDARGYPYFRKPSLGETGVEVWWNRRSKRRCQWRHLFGAIPPPLVENAWRTPLLINQTEGKGHVRTNTLINNAIIYINQVIHIYIYIHTHMYLYRSTQVACIHMYMYTYLYMTYMCMYASTLPHLNYSSNFHGTPQTSLPGYSCRPSQLSCLGCIWVSWNGIWFLK